MILNNKIVKTPEVPVTLFCSLVKPKHPNILYELACFGSSGNLQLCYHIPMSYSTKILIYVCNNRC